MRLASSASGCRNASRTKPMTVFTSPPTKAVTRAIGRSISARPRSQTALGRARSATESERRKLPTVPEMAATTPASWAVCSVMKAPARSMIP